MGFRILKAELVKTFLKKRTYLGFLIVGLIVPLVEIAMKLEGGRYTSMTLRALQRDFFFIGDLFNGWFVSYQIMQSLWFHVPLLISFVAGDMLAGEATAGTYRIVLIRPVSRTRIFLVKYLTSLLYTALFVAFLGVLSIGLAYALLGGGELLIFDRGITLLPRDDVAWRFLTAYLLAIWSMITIASLAVLFSSFVENAIGPIVATMGVLIVSQIIVFIPLEFFEALRPHLFASYLNLWQKVFADPVAWRDILTGGLYLGGYSLAFMALAWTVFVRKDVLS